MKAEYFDPSKPLKENEVVIVTKDGKRITTWFATPYEAMKFVRKCKYSKNVTVVSCPSY